MKPKKKRIFCVPELKWIVICNRIDTISTSYTNDPGKNPLEPDIFKIIEQEEGTDSIFWNGENK